MSEQTVQSTLRILPELALVTAMCVTVLVDVVSPRNLKAAAAIAAAGLLAALLFSVRQMGTSDPAFSGMIAVDPFAVFFKILTSAASLVIVVFSLFAPEIRQSVRRIGEYFSLLLSMTLGMFLMAGATNLLMMVLAMELTSLSSYIVAGFTKEARDSSEASLKYVLYGAVSSGLMLYGISILFGLTGALNIYAVNSALVTTHPNTVTLLAATVLITAGFGFKISAVPFHFWTPDVYEGAPITITAFLSVASKAAGFAMLIRFLKVTLIDSSMLVPASGVWTAIHGIEWNKIIAILSVLTMTLGNLVAIWQDNLKRLLAYSSIAHAGYMLMGLVVMNDKGIAAVLIYFVVYFIMNLGAFYVVMLVAEKTGSEHIDSYRGLGYRSPLLGVSFVIFLISLTGLPPTAGFVGKLYLFAALLDAKWIWLAIVGALNSVISLYYYVRIFRNVFLRDPAEAGPPLVFSRAQIAVLLCLVIPTLLFGVYFTPIVNLANASVAMLGGR